MNMSVQNQFKQTEIGEIPNEWDVANLGDLVNVIGGAPFKSKDFVSSGYPILKIANVKPMKLLLEDLDYISSETAKRYESAKLKKDDLLITMTGNRYGGGPDSWVGKVAIFNQDNNYYLNQRVGILRSKDNKTNIRFLSYYLGSTDLQRKLVMMATGAGGQANISPSQIKALKVPFPKLDEQEQIASVLSSLDDKIELNRRINKTLEEMGKVLFKRWFVDFEFPNEYGEPYKSSGGEMVESELGEIPKGWKASRVREIATLKSGFAFKGSSFKDSGKYGVIKIKNVIDPDVDVMDIQFVSEEEVKDRARQFILNSGDILIAMSGNTTGKIGILVKGDYELVLNQRVGKYFLKDTNYQWYLYFLLRSGDIQKSIVEKAYGSAQPNISPSLLEDITLLIPDNNALNKFNEISRHLMKSYVKNYTENMKLTKLRDSLLPRLMSGRIRVN